MFLASEKPVTEWLTQAGSHEWHSKGNLLPVDLAFKPFYDVQHERYSAYLDVFTQAEWAAREAQYRKQEADLADLNARSIDFFQPGEMQSERDHNITSENSGPGEWQGRKLRHAWGGGWFSFDLKVDPTVSSDVVFTYWGGDNRTFDVLIDGNMWATEVLNGNPAGKFVDRVHSLTPEILAGRHKVSIRIQAKPNGWAGGLFGVRVLRAKS